MNANPSVSREHPGAPRKGGWLSAARRLVGVAGAPAGWARRQTRRGSFLVLVVGTLALMSVFAIVYIAIGRSDAGLGIGVQRNATRDDVPKQFADYVAGIVAEDVFSVTAEPDSPGMLALRREASDYPGTVWELRSDEAPNGSNRHLVFDPVGTYRTQWQGGGVDPRGPSDPWLASSEPTWLHFDPNIAQENAAVPFLDYRDWAHISNVAPDGMFVNLYRLRSNFGASALALKVKRADEPLFNPADGGQIDTTDFGGALPIASFQGESGVVVQPAYLSSRQARAFRSVNDNVGDPDDPFYTPYLWGDADGDGMYDSRWIEMTDSRDANNIRSLIDPGNKYRYFFATRIVDLSGMVNITTALDFIAPPEDDERAGKTPGEIDLRRLLSLEDVFTAIPPIANVGGGYQMLKQPPGNDTGLNARADNYTSYDQATAVGVGGWAFHAMYNEDNALLPLGAMVTGIVPAAERSSNGNPFVFPDAESRTDMYEELGGVGGGSSFNAGRYDLSALFGADSLAELLTYRGINDPGYSSPLETILGGRYTAPGQIPTTRRYSPLRENRGFDLELSRPANATPQQIQEIMAWSYADVRQRITTLSGARPLKSSVITKIAQGAPVTTQETTLSTGELKDRLSTDEATLFRAYGNALIPDSGIDHAWPDGSPEFDQIRFQHYGYRSPEVALIMAAHMTVNLKDGDDGDVKQSAFTVIVDEEARDGFVAGLGGSLNSDYGDSANRTNPKDISARANRWAWWVEGRQLDLGSNAAGNPNRASSRLADSPTGDTPTRAAMNVYGVEPQPVLTAVASYYMYTDTPVAQGGDDDLHDNGDGTYTGEATINGTIDVANSDFLMQVIAFQITNPFGQAVDLTSDGSGGTVDEQFVYYIEFNGRYFRLSEVDPANPTGSLTGVSLAPGQTRVFYATSSDLASVQSRWSAIDSSIVTAGGYERVRDWVNTQLNPGSAAFGTPVWIEEMDPTTPSFRNSYSAVMTDLIATNGTASNDVVRLWRAMRSTVGGAGEALPGGQYLENDLLVDRLRIPQTSGGLVQKFPDGNNTITGTQNDGTYADGISITRWAYCHRPGDPAGAAADGSFPAYMIESRIDYPLNTRNSAGKGPDGETAGDYSGANGYLRFHEPGTGTGLVDMQCGGGPAIVTEVVTDPENFPAIGVNNTGIPFSDMRAEVCEGIGGGDLRVADLLLPVAVGAEFNPAGATLDERWITLGESLALAFGYDDPPAGDLYYEFGTAGSQFGPLTDRGCLALDRFVPFFDADADGMFRAVAGSPDAVRGLGIPLALNVFEQFHGLEGFTASLNRPFFGQVNISTASLPVLRCLPMLSPTGSAAGNPNWWWAGANHDYQSDIAATILSYRDKVRVPVRTDSTAVPAALADMFTDGVLPSDTANLDGRFLGSRIDAIRERPGFASVGEIMAARLIDANDVDGTRGLPTNIDYLGFNGPVGAGLNDSRLGVDSITHNGVANGLSNEYGERLSIANAVMNSVTVRSDYFACWFLVHGYQRSDTVRDGGQALGPNDPLVPSIQRRFLMVLDRSNVVKKGDRPRVVLFKEVPL